MADTEEIYILFIYAHFSIVGGGGGGRKVSLMPIIIHSR